MCTWRELVATGSRTLPHAFSMGKKGKGAARPKTPPPPPKAPVFLTPPTALPTVLMRV